MALACASIGLVARYLPISNHALVAVAVGSPYLILGAPVALILFLLSRRWISAIVACGTTVAVVAIQLPLYVQAPAQAGTTSIRVMTANLYLGKADARDLVATASTNADVVAVQELTQTAAENLSEAGLDKSFPYRVFVAHDVASGAGLWSRYPITESDNIAGFEMTSISAQIAVEGAAPNPMIIVAHLSAPWPQPMIDWEQDMQRMQQTMNEATASTTDGCVIVAGDFNGTLDMRPFRQLLTDGYRDAAEQSGAGLTPTYPANSRIPAFMAINHVLTNRCTATAADTVALYGSHHEGLIATIEIAGG